MPTCMARCWSSRTCPTPISAVLFLHNEGYSTMCGHAVIALGRYAVDRRAGAGARAGDDGPHPVPMRPGHGAGSRCRMVAPAGSVSAACRLSPSRAMPSSSPHGLGPVMLDIAYGGAFYGVLPAAGARARPGDSPLSAAGRGRHGNQGGGLQARLPVAHPDGTRPGVSLWVISLKTAQPKSGENSRPIYACSPTARSTEARPAQA